MQSRTKDNESYCKLPQLKLPGVKSTLDLVKGSKASYEFEQQNYSTSARNQRVFSSEAQNSPPPSNREKSHRMMEVLNNADDEMMLIIKRKQRKSAKQTKQRMKQFEFLNPKNQSTSTSHVRKKQKRVLSYHSLPQQPAILEPRDIINDASRKVPINFVNALTQANPVFLSKDRFPSSPKIFHKVKKSKPKQKKLLKLSIKSNIDTLDILKRYISPRIHINYNTIDTNESYNFKLPPQPQQTKGLKKRKISFVKNSPYFQQIHVPRSKYPQNNQGRNIYASIQSQSQIKYRVPKLARKIIRIDSSCQKNLQSYNSNRVTPRTIEPPFSNLSQMNREKVYYK